MSHDSDSPPDKHPFFSPLPHFGGAGLCERSQDDDGANPRVGTESVERKRGIWNADCPSTNKQPIGAVLVVGGGIGGMQASLDLREEVKGLLARQPIYREPAAIESKDLVRLQVFAQRHERGVGEIHRHLMIFLHQGGDALQTLMR